jgi:hypothetical protein
VPAFNQRGATLIQRNCRWFSISSIPICYNRCAEVPHLFDYTAVGPT